MENKPAQPEWFEGEIPEDSWRAFFKWGAPQSYKHPNSGLVRIIHDRLEFDDEELKSPTSLGLGDIPNKVAFQILGEKNIDDLNTLVGPQNVSTKTGNRIKAGYGQAYYDAVRLREGTLENLPDIVITPENEEMVQNVLAYCVQNQIPLYVVSGRSSVTRGFEAVKGGITLDMSVHMNQIISFNETNQMITVQPGIYGPKLERSLNDAVGKFGAKRAYTCGHFPQSFEYSTVGGWVATRGAGQNSTYYGKIEDMVISQKYITPAGTIQTQDFPRQATGPDIDQIMIGSEASFGVLVEVTLKVFRYLPENRRHFSYMFKDWQSALAATREIMQTENGFPSVFRISDPEETEIAMHMYKVAGGPAEKLLAFLGFEANKKCLMLGWTEGGKHLSKASHRNIKQICRAHNALSLNLFQVTKKWQHGRFRDPYMRDDLADFGIIIDTLECSVTWENVEKVHSGVRSVIKAHENIVCMTHMSHMYPQGGNLYFIFLKRYKDRQDYLRLQYSILEAIYQNGASMSHHHGMGKQIAPWLEGQIGSKELALLKSIKDHFDPNNILNPGGTLGLDMSEEQAEKRWGI
jgi:alkyldihydroxyacetonephosphate synthase